VCELFENFFKEAALSFMLFLCIFSFGPIRCKDAFKLRQDPRLKNALVNVAEAKSNIAKDKAIKDKQQKETEPVVAGKTTSVSKSSPIKGKQSPKKVSGFSLKKPEESNPNRLKNMFAAAAAKPKEVKEKRKPEEPAKPSSKVEKCFPAGKVWQSIYSTICSSSYFILVTE